MIRILRTAIVCLILMPAAAVAQDRQFRLAAPDHLVESGLMKHMLPRFTLKHRTRVELSTDAPQAVLSTTAETGGRAVFRGDTHVYYLRVDPENAHAQRFSGWITSDIGKRTLEAFAPENGTRFTAAIAAQQETETGPLVGNAALGAQVSQTKCGRCHVVDPAKKMTGIGSTPSFFVLRALPNWEERFSAFFALNPHPSFTQITDVTPAFDSERPPPISPIALTLEDIDHIQAYVAGLAPADLGAPVAHQ